MLARVWLCEKESESWKAREIEKEVPIARAYDRERGVAAGREKEREREREKERERERVRTWSFCREREDLLQGLESEEKECEQKARDLQRAMLYVNESCHTYE